MWDERYGSDEYAYGKIANTFLQQNYQSLPKGKVLSLAEGEGRNAVFLARQGYQVTAVDASRVGLNKARKLAEEHDVEIECIHADLTVFDLGENQWDGIVSIFCPLPSAMRKQLYQRVQSALKPNGVFLLEAYTPRQVDYGTGGGKNIDTMQSETSLATELAALHFQHLQELEREVIEGRFHTGLASVVQAIGIK